MVEEERMRMEEENIPTSHVETNEESSHQHCNEYTHENKRNFRFELIIGSAASFVQLYILMCMNRMIVFVNCAIYKYLQNV